jgi:hypothetical protein
MKILENTQGMFGPVWVFDRQGVRSLAIGSQVQGGSVLDVHGDPGPIADSLYMNGWLMAGACRPDASGLMLGLGSGAGCTALLENFPDLDLTVVEIDPVVISVANTWFPLLARHQDSGRLRVVHADAADYVQASQAQGDRWDTGFVDAYQGQNELAVHDRELQAFMALVDNTWFNTIVVPGSPRHLAFRQLVRQNAQGLTREWDCQPGQAPGLPHNLVCTNAKVDDQVLDSLEPYENYDGPGVDDARARYRQVLQAETQLTA